MIPFYRSEDGSSHVHAGDGRTVCGVVVGVEWDPMLRPSPDSVCSACRLAVYVTVSVDEQSTGSVRRARRRRRRT